MSDPVDFKKLESAVLRALFRHQLSELEMVVAGTVLRLSLGIGRVWLRLDRPAQLSAVTGLSAAKVHDVVNRLVRCRVLHVSDDRRQLSIRPVSKSWPWLFPVRGDDSHTADELERAIIAANTDGPELIL